MKGFLVRGEVAGVADAGILSERDVELALAVEAAKPVEAGAIQVVEQRRSFGGVLLAVGDELVEAGALAVEQPLVVLHLQIGLEPLLKPAVKIDEMGVGVVKERAFGQEPERDRQPPAKGLDEPRSGMRFPKRPEVRYLPALSAGPLQGWTERGRHSGCGHSASLPLETALSLKRVRPQSETWPECWRLRR